MLKRPKLETMRELLEFLGHPERSFKICHVAGSKGKGSTARMLAEMLAAETGREVGVYASPHVSDWRERIGTTRGFLADEVYARACERVERARGVVSELTWFEMMTAVAFCCFEELGLEWAVVEAGIGGRADVTNAIERPELSIITAIERTHCEKLGHRIEEIAWQKGGIVRPGVPVVLAQQKHPEAARVISEIGGELGSQVVLAEALPGDYEVKMRGAVQRENAATARTAAGLLGVSDGAVREGLKRAELPGRFELRALGEAVLVMDAAHTLESWRAAIETYEELSAISAAEYAGRPRFLLARFKAGEEGMSEVKAMAEAVFQKVWEAKAGDDEVIGQALEEAQRERALMLVAGSFYLLGEVEKVLQDRKNVL